MGSELLVENRPDIQLSEDVARFYADPLGFVMFAYPWGQPGTLEHHDGPDKWQKDFLIELGEEVRKRGFNGINPVSPIRMAVSSGHGIGKSTLVAWLVDWIMSSRPRARGTITASTFQQLDSKTWAAIQHWTKLCITAHWFEVTSDSIYYRGQKESWRVSAQSCKEENSEAFAGQHAVDSTSFYVFDEASAISDKIFEVAEGGLTDGEPMMFLFGNPTRNTGKFPRVMFGVERSRWIRRTVDSRTSKLTNKQQIQEWINDYGEDSDFVRVRVRGECPRAGCNQLIPTDVVAAARKYKADGYTHLPKIGACDVARFGDDKTVIGDRQGRRARIYGHYRGLDTVQVGERCIEYINAEQPEAFVVDGDGLGAGVFDYIKHRGYSSETLLVEFRGGMAAYDQTLYYNRRAEVWSLMGAWLKEGAEIPDNPEVEVDITGPQYGFSSKGQIQLEKKEDMKKRGLDSPDFGDTFAMTFGVNVMPRPKPAMTQNLWALYGDQAWMS